ncbi:MAG TPA: TonB family protein [Gemmatimonadales bacterium]|nr:TonB family protein [Gemmatimonadales bacterium]
MKIPPDANVVASASCCARKARVLLTAALLLGFSAPAQAQDAVVDPAVLRLAWGSLNVLVQADTVAGLVVWAQTSATTATPLNYNFFAVFDPDSLASWLDYAKRLVETKDPPHVAGSTAIRTPPLYARDSSAIVFLRQRQGTKWEGHARLYFFDSGGNNPWYVEAPRKEALNFISALFLQGAASHMAPESALLRYGSLSDSSARSEGSSTLFTGPKLIETTWHLLYPRSMQQEGREGEVWISFVILPDSTADSTSFRILLADHQAFADAAIAAIRDARFVPAGGNGSAVPIRISQRLVFRLGWSPAARVGSKELPLERPLH